MSGQRYEPFDVKLEFPPTMLAELGYEANRRNLSLNQLIVFWLEDRLQQHRFNESRSDAGSRKRRD